MYVHDNQMHFLYMSTILMLMCRLLFGVSAVCSHDMLRLFTACLGNTDQQTMACLASYTFYSLYRGPSTFAAAAIHSVHTA